ncbi:cephalosporin-C deacetylase [Catalinimonas alkaloidigena]|uniref:Cephalosporin-C deacetylase n=1 Tax=Catalinimonas alkaloidigena TaxID=1075417 RepID=A0A1G9SF34_9BACT|nr:acetylxylan esterase [Catalinimonas alkaloidigena]SDM34012.1 cephalosporin-C deacetylase [Catalinimonas alkaloidigena]
MPESVSLPDPAHPFPLSQLLQIEPPPTPDDFAAVWRERYRQARAVHPKPRIIHTGTAHPDFELYDLQYQSTDQVTLGGWVLIPKHEPVRRGVVVGHGYGGRDAPDFHLPIREAALLFPCFRGLSRSPHPPISPDPQYHVLHDIDRPDRYILRGCTEDLWLGVSALLHLFPAVAGHVGYLGISFGGGIGALALPWDLRIRRAHFNVPTFGHHPLRMQYPTYGSGAALQSYQQRHGDALSTLAYYDAAVAARFVQVPVHVAAALSDPMVTPPGQFAIYNALPHPKQRYVLRHGHAEYEGQAQEEEELLQDLNAFFHDL